MAFFPRACIGPVDAKFGDKSHLLWLQEVEHVASGLEQSVRHHALQGVIGMGDAEAHDLGQHPLANRYLELPSRRQTVGR